MLPDYYYESIFTIPYADFRKKNMRGLIFDVDNTLALYSEARPSAKVSSLIKRLQRMGFTITLLTNNTKKRAEIFNEKMQLHAIHGGRKPFASGILRAMQAMGTKADETIIIGDQLLADVWAGKNAKITTILVKPMGRDTIAVRWKRGIERRMLRKLSAEANRLNPN